MCVLFDSSTHSSTLAKLITFSSFVFDAIDNFDALCENDIYRLKVQMQPDNKLNELTISNEPDIFLYVQHKFGLLGLMTLFIAINSII